MRERLDTIRQRVDPMEKTQHDTLYQTERPYKHFRFDQEVVSVFPDMISRSVPGYWLSTQTIGLLCQRFSKPKTNIYDLGCSLGATIYSILEQQPQNDAQIIAVDASTEMITHLRESLDLQYPSSHVELYCADIQNFPLSNASVIILHYTLQFIPPAQRDRVLSAIQAALIPGGVLLIAEKIRFSEAHFEDRIRTWHHDFKAAQGYSPLEIEQKARDISKSMQTDTLEQLESRFQRAGFSKYTMWMRCYGFSAFVVEK